ncbi:polysaccharide deacetylase [Rhodoplanes sp.]|uniref:polysaccharide deacetylase family protein n=1 Tax=Rhodoplanes sp. TaxID=1968906 RepID=UPI0025CE3949|nr:polysaccharide deacetylase [Rhodoplanes sp.]
MPRHIVCLTFDFDTESGFIARGMTTPTPLSRGEFGLVGAARILDLLKAHGIRATWFTPGFTIESHPEMCALVVEAGHEIGHHGWSHVAPAAMTRDEEEADLLRATESIRRLTGAAPVGYRSPAWDLSENTLSLLEAQGFLYDSSLMGADYWPYRVRRGDVAELGKPYVKGPETDLIEMPISWTLDDHPHFEYLRTPQGIMPGLQSPRVVMQNWLDEFLYMRKSVNWGVLTYTMHPYVIGRGFRMLAFEEFLGKLIDGGVVFMTMVEAAREARGRLGGGER